MRVGFDARYVSHGLTGGVRTYVYEIGRRLPDRAPADEFFYYADCKAPFELRDLPANVTVRMLPWRSAVSSFVNDARLAQVMDRDGVDVAHYPGNYGPRGRARLVVTLHDTLNLFSMGAHLRGFGKRPRQVAMMAYLGWRSRRALRQADAVITISEHARADIARRSGFPLDRLTAIHEAAGAEFRPIADPTVLQEARSRFDLRHAVVLADGIKNPDATIDAVRRLPDRVRAGVTLVFFSRESAPRPAVAAAIGDPGVRFIARPATADLAILMNLADVFVFPSWFEGFGLPLVEAMSCGTPVVASSRGSIPEVLGGAGIVADLESPGELGARLQDVLESPSLRRDLRARSLARAAAFSWTATADRTLEVYRQVAAGGPRTEGR